MTRYPLKENEAAVVLALKAGDTLTEIANRFGASVPSVIGFARTRGLHSGKRAASATASTTPSLGEMIQREVRRAKLSVERAEKAVKAAEGELAAVQRLSDAYYGK